MLPSSSLLPLAGLLLLAAPAPAADAGAITLPTRFDANRVYVVPRTRDGRTLTFYTDSGGGLFIDEAAVKRLGLATEAMSAGGDVPPGAKAVRLPAFQPGFSIPAPQANDGRIFIAPSSEADLTAKGGVTGDGLLGEMWFGGHVWTWDYPGKRLLLEGAGWRPSAQATRAAIGFRTGADGKREGNFPRLVIRVDGKPIDVLLDTGATTLLTPGALKTLADGLPAARATSMIVDTEFQAWHQAHPDWRVIKDAQQSSHASMIEVPEVEIAGARVGPVWFTWRPDANFHKFMSSYMDRQVEGSIGGNALRHFVMTIDYPGSVAWFRCVRDCKLTPRSAP
jgi:hypothetical protein